MLCVCIGRENDDITLAVGKAAKATSFFSSARVVTQVSMSGYPDGVVRRVNRNGMAAFLKLLEEVSFMIASLGSSPVTAGQKFARACPNWEASSPLLNPLQDLA